MKKRCGTALAAVALVAVGCCTDPNEPDAGSPDAGRDGGRDGGRDAGVDAGRDAGPGMWVPVEGLFPSCRVTMRVDASGADPLIEAPCDDRPGCRVLGPSWPNEGSPWFIVHRRVGAHDGTRGLIVASHNVGLDRETRSDMLEHVVYTDSGAPVAVWRSVPPDEDARCYLSDVVPSAHGYALVVVEVESADSFTDHVLGGQLSPAATLPRSLHRFTTAERMGNSAQDVLVGASQLAVGLQPGGHAYRLGWDGALVRVGSFPMDGAQAFVASVVGDALFYDSFGLPKHTVRVSIDGAPSQVLIDPAGAEASMFRSDGVDMVWLQGYGRQRPLRFDRLELWTSAYTADAATVAPRSVAVLRTQSLQTSLRVGFGYAAWAHSGAEVEVFRLADGARAIITSPDEVEWDAILYLGPAEVALVTWRRDVFPPETSHLMFVRYDSLTFVPP